MKTPNPSVSDYLNSPFLIEVVIVLVFGVALLLTLFRARRIAWSRQQRGRRAAILIAWLALVATTLWWTGMLYLTIEALRSDVETYFPKKVGILVPLIGGLVYFLLIALSNALLSAGRETPDPSLE